ncbi:MAG: protein-disulfide reductase DsbD family protein [Pseudomonadales bacterium]|nr:protein-disulfide reductase DsbD family protein [Pseudomonadales bacterium]
MLTLLAGLWPGVYAQSLSEITGSANPLENNRFLPVEDAFRFHTSLHSRETLLISWQIADGYYLYQDKFHFSVPQNSTENWQLAHKLPAAVPHTDEFFGDVNVYYTEVTAEIDISAFQQSSMTLDVQFQGCSEDGLCYPLQTRRIQLDL